MKALSILFLLLSAFALITFIKPTSEICANSISCIKDLSGTFENEQQGEFMGKAVNIPKSLAYVAQADIDKSVLGEKSSSKRIEVDLTAQRVYAFEDGNKVFDFLVSTGKWGRTPTGHFKIWIKLRYTKMSGGSKELGTYYYLPNVPYVMFFYNDQIPKSRGYGLHGTYWHNNFGHVMSHGCINMKTEEVAQLYAWAMPVGGSKGVVYASNDNPGTDIYIYGEAPQE